MLIEIHSHANRQLRRRPQPPAHRLPGNKFGGLVGELDHVTLSPHDGTRPDDNHIYLWVRVPAGPRAGKYECAVNTESTDGSKVQYAVHEEPIEAGEFPSFGFFDAEVSYAGLQLHQTEFTDVDNGRLRSAVENWAQTASMVVAYGFVYPRGDGLHDVHMNSGEPAGSSHPNHDKQDGALVFYYRNGQNSIRRWVFIKFHTQQLP